MRKSRAVKPVERFWGAATTPTMPQHSDSGLDRINGDARRAAAKRAREEKRGEESELELCSEVKVAGRR